MNRRKVRCRHDLVWEPTRGPKPDHTQRVKPSEEALIAKVKIRHVDTNGLLGNRNPRARLRSTLKFFTRHRKLPTQRDDAMEMLHSAHTGSTAAASCQLQHVQFSVMKKKRLFSAQSRSRYSVATRKWTILKLGWSSSNLGSRAPMERDKRASKTTKHPN
ncbi:hypothetical protein BU23DRAFT_270498 [Bimuria novae-zelandiae CBS 107.79]|uniref:Uncharacterized protein n=1 Tax=Bimuria novae-zelandiae CBS 107.79 TaxID=1447943 RepID=A0A6A5V491_9PLEO|nr:hypothetical protein BU23DRAFT_270498 [Bimuria novae-zelandiae CBS 107.79]